MAETRDILEAMEFALSNRVTKLNDKNYTRWKREMELRFKGNGLWNIVTDERPAPSINDDRLKKEARVFTDILDSCEPDQQDLIMDCEHPKAAWDALKQNF